MTSPPWSEDTDEMPGGRRTGQLMAGKYRLLRLIGRGGMGEVYEAQHAVVGRRFAVKFLHPHLAQSGSALLRFRREAQAAGALESEHIAAVTDFDTADDGAPFLVMEYLVGESLGQLLAREGPLPLGRVVSALLQVCRGLEAAHAAGIIHRDLKPDNLFLVKRADGSDLLKILDFGIAKLSRGEASADITRSGATLGTPFYMAPEQARGEKTISERVDVYALGVITYELLSGKKPHPGDSYNSILAHILSQPVAPLASLRPGLPSGFAAFVERALSSAPERRQPSAAAFAQELSAFAGREVATVHSHFELRTELGGAATVPTPDAHTVSVVRDEAAPRALSEPARESGTPKPTQARAFAPLLLVFVGVSAAVWLLARQAEDAGRGVSAVAASAAPAPSGSHRLSAPPPVAITQAERAATGAAAGSAAQPLASSSAQSLAPSERARSAGRPQSRPTVRSLASAPSTTPPPSLNVASAVGGSASSATNPRVTFDEKNPY